MKAKKILLLALLSGIITTGIFYLVVIQNSSADSAQAEKPEMETVVVASTDIKQDEKLTEENTTVKDMVKADVHSDAVRNREEIVGKYTASAIKSDEVLLQHRIREQGETTEFLSRKINEEMRGVSINVKYDASVSNLTVPEDYVDVYLNTVEKPDATPIMVKTELLFKKLRVLAVGERIIEKGKTEGEEKYITVTLEVTPEQALELINSAQVGTFHLALHSRLKSDEKTKKNDTDEESANAETDQPNEHSKTSEDKKDSQAKESAKKENKKTDDNKNDDNK
ncbi:Flp pilus assembly protein CpaB [Virgibacillus siamensis]|uniref:Flp pilus assembly protein CpaB n=1 Tax=Virgibacillus siamensis TaxID=480071 RepID=A0ABN1FHS9_9BACI